MTKSLLKIKTVKESSVKKLIKYPAEDANKYTRGKLTILGGSAQYPGAACLAGKSSLRCGSGYVEVYCDAKSVPVVQGHDCNLVVRDWSLFSCSSAKLDVVSANHPSACLIGSGFGEPDHIQEKLLWEVLENAKCPVVIDGSALTSLATPKGIEMARGRYDQGYETIVTPHYGEAERLSSAISVKPPVSQSKHLEDIARYATSIAEAYGLTVVLKGPVTLISPRPDSKGASQVFLMDKGPACLAKAGTGDVLAGMMGSFLSQGSSSIDAAKLATFTHARAARIAEKKLTSVCVCATDVIDYLSSAFKSYGRDA